MQIIIKFIVSQAPIIREGGMGSCPLFSLVKIFLDDFNPPPTHTHIKYTFKMTLGTCFKLQDLF